MRLNRWLGALAIAAVTSPASADILVWRDSAGISHYTNDLANVPVEYRKDAMTVAKDWARAAPPPEPPAPAPGAAAATDDGRTSARDTYEAAFAAGYRAGEEGEAPVAAANTGSVVQNVQVAPAAPGVVDRLIPVPVVVERQRGRQPSQREEERETRNNFPPASRAPFLQGPAGPPPVTDR